MGSFSFDVGSVDVYFRDVAQIVVENAQESELLQALADFCRCESVKAQDTKEKAFFDAASVKFAELAKWIEASQK